MAFRRGSAGNGCTFRMNTCESNNLADVLPRAVEQSSTIVVVTDPNGDIEYVNPMFCTVTGYTRDEMVGRSTRVLKSGRMPPSIYVDLWAKLRSGRDWQGEFLNRRKDGSLYWESAVISAVQGGGGAIEHYLKVAEDVTARRGLEERLKTSQKCYERVVMAMRGFMFTVLFENGEPARTLHYPGTQEVTGYTPEEYQANPALWFDMIVEEDRERVTDQIRIMQKEKKLSTVEHRILHKNGTVRWVRNVSVPTLDEEQRLISYDGLITDITEFKEMEIQRDGLLDEMRRLAARDALTGLYSRRVLDEELNRAWQLSERHGLALGLLMVDLDHFKVLNDTYGHQVGDEVLVETARLIRSAVRAGDVVVRYGGDEIVVILPLTDLKETRRVGERLLRTFRGHIFCRGAHDLRATVSVGVASGVGREQPAAKMLMLVDRALYRAKQRGRNLLCLAEPGAKGRRSVDEHAASKGAMVAAAAKNEGSARGRVLIVDDDETIGSALSAFLKGERYSVAVAPDPDKAYAIADGERGQVDVVLVDLLLANHNGLQVLKQLRLMDDTLVGIVMTGHATVDNTAEAMRAGAVDFIQKPVLGSQLALIIERAMQYRRFLQENRNYQRHLEEMVAERSTALSRALGEVERLRRSVVETLAAAFEAHDRDAGEHSRRVVAMVQILAREMGAAPEEVESIGQGARLHDIGKIGIPDANLMKPGALTPEEWRVVKLHPRIGCDLARFCPGIEEAAAVILEHHERFDGSGYPHGLKGQAISLGARIVAVAETYDVIRSNRPYAPRRSVEQAIAEIVRCRGTQFDPGVVDAFLRVQPLLEECIAGDRDK